MKGKAVRENHVWWGSPNADSSGIVYPINIPHDNWEIIKYIGIPKKYIIWQTKIIK
jgi:hypothetical protein